MNPKSILSKINTVMISQIIIMVTFYKTLEYDNLGTLERISKSNVSYKYIACNTFQGTIPFNFSNTKKF